MLFLEYRKYQNDPNSSFMKLLDLFDESGAIAEKLIDYRTVDREVYKTFLDLSMVACCKGSFKTTVACDDQLELQDIMTNGEETFAMLLLENNRDKWIHLAIDGDDDNMPHSKYQKKIEKRKDEKMGVGDWNESGLQRFNDIARMVKEKRNEGGRHVFEKAIKAMYEKEHEKARQKNRKRKADDASNGNNDESPRGCIVINLFDANVC